MVLGTPDSCQRPSQRRRQEQRIQGIETTAHCFLTLSSQLVFSAWEEEHFSCRLVAERSRAVSEKLPPGWFFNRRGL
jgi:hypothetical protein